MNDLTMNLDTQSGISLYEQIYTYIKEEIQNGGLPCKKRLPSTRKLAEHLQISRTTVNLAYEQLLSEGYIEALPQRGYFVCAMDSVRPFKESERQPERKGYDFARKEPVATALKEEIRYDFSPYGVDVNSFPHNAWRKLSRNLLLEENQSFFRLGEPQGERKLRETIATYLREARGVHASMEQIVVGAGNDFLLLLLCSMFGSGMRIAMESPTYRKAYDLFSNLSNRVHIVEMDESGMRVDALEETGAWLAYVMPSHQYPLGTVMPVGRRMQLLRWAAKKEGRYILEDDYDSEFRYKGKPIPALQGYDSEGRVIYLGTFSRSIAPAIRVSYMVLPKRLLDLYHKRAGMISSTVSRLDQMLIADFLNEGYYERHLNKMRALYRGRHDLLLEELKAFRGICHISGENAGVHLLLTFQNGMTEEEAMERAAKKGVRVYALSEFYVGEAKQAKKDTVLLGYANLSEEEIREAVRRLLDAWIS